MDKINYNQHDWNKGEVIKEENLDNMENGIKQATDKINEIIDTEQDFKDRMADIDGRIDINNEELVIARDGCDNLGQRIERDQQYIYNILNDGSYLEFNGTDITVDNSKEGYTSNMLIKGQTYQNLAPKVTKYLHNAKSTNDGKFTIIEQTSTSIVLKINSELTSWRYISCGKVDINMLKANTEYTFCGDFENIASILIQTGDGLYIASDFLGATNNKFKIRTKDANTLNSIPQNSDLIIYVSYNQSVGFTGKVACKNVVLLEGDWTNKEVPSSITGIESVGEKENNKISILSHGKNLFNKENANDYVGFWVDNGSRKIKKDDSGLIYSVYVNNIKKGCVYALTERIDRDDARRNRYAFVNERMEAITIKDSVVTDPAPPNAKGLLWYISSIGLSKQELESIQIEENQKTSYEPYKQNKKEISLPMQGGLKSLPDGVADTIEQREDGVYLVQRIKKYTITGNEDISLRTDVTLTNGSIFGFYMNDNSYKTGTDFLNNAFISSRNMLNDREFVRITLDPSQSKSYIAVGILNNKLATQDVEGFKQWLKANPITIYYELNTPVETKLDIDTLNLKVFKDVTYILSENNIKPEIVCKAPVDVNQTIADLQEEQEQLMETYNTLKDENKAVKMAISELNEQEDVQTADMLDLDMRVLALEEGLE